MDQEATDAPGVSAEAVSPTYVSVPARAVPGPLTLSTGAVGVTSRPKLRRALSPDGSVTETTASACSGAAGAVQVSRPVTGSTDDPAGPLTRAYRTLVRSGSDADRLTVTGWFSDTVTLASASSAGGSFMSLEVQRATVSGWAAISSISAARVRPLFMRPRVVPSSAWVGARPKPVWIRSAMYWVSL